MELSVYGVMKSNDPRFVYRYIKSFDGICRYTNHYTKFIYYGTFLTGSRTLMGKGYIISYNNQIQITIGRFYKNKPINTVTYKIIPNFFKLKCVEFKDCGFSHCDVYYARIYDNAHKIAKIYVHRKCIIDLEIIDVNINADIYSEIYHINQMLNTNEIKYEYDVINTTNNDWMDKRERELYQLYKKNMLF